MHYQSLLFGVSNRAEVASIEDLKAPGSKFVEGEKYDAIAKGTANAKRRINYLKNKCQNNLHASGKLLCDSDIVLGIRLTVLGSDAFSEEYSRSTQTAGQAKCHEWFLDRAYFGCLVALKQMFATLQSPQQLERAGIDVTFTQDRRR